MDVTVEHSYDCPRIENCYENDTIETSNHYGSVWPRCDQGNDKCGTKPKEQNFRCCVQKKLCLMILLVILALNIVVSIICVVLLAQGGIIERDDLKDLSGSSQDQAAQTFNVNMDVKTSNVSVKQLEDKMKRLLKRIDHFRKIRLVDGRNEKEGRVEILHDGQWGTICDDNWGLKEAIIVCEMLGFTDATDAISNAEFGPGSGIIWLDQVACTGIESNIGDCTHSGWGSHNCNHEEDASVVCN